MEICTNCICYPFCNKCNSPQDKCKDFKKRKMSYSEDLKKIINLIDRLDFRDNGYDFYVSDNVRKAREYLEKEISNEED